ncbi:hypothetical protein MMC13_004988 [Lambiella insularis]|nr:hypothetical protein [Lambiella insularis]
MSAGESLRRPLASDHVGHLTDAFGALLSKVEDLALKNGQLQKQLKEVQAQNKSERSQSPSDHAPQSVLQGNNLSYREAGSFISNSERKDGLQPRRPSNTTDVIILEEEKPWYEDEIIKSGVRAWKHLRAKTDQQGPSNPKAPGPTPIFTASSRTDIAAAAHGDAPVATEQGFVTKSPLPNLRCPFAPKTAFGQQSRSTSTSSIQEEQTRRCALPTPPDTRESLFEDPTAAKIHDANLASPSPSANGSASKCPIRFLDQHSPEEVARYFTLHKHEIPRSHEVCVKRYQMNEESIRQLDAKYGNLVSMIQGLGMKHQPILATKESDAVETYAAEDVAAALLDRQSKEKVEKWATNCTESVHATVEEAVSQSSGTRSGHFDRPLKDIRVGESPTRPWGISVPYIEGSASSSCPGEVASKEAVPSVLLSKIGAPPLTETRRGPQKFDRCPFSHQKSGATNTSGAIPSYQDGWGSQMMEEGEPVKKQTSIEAESNVYDKPTLPNMVFNGPVFIGYSAEQAANLLQNYLNPTMV